jgi:DNA helicase HerA-like ATPase
LLFKQILESLLGYTAAQFKNVTVIDLSGVPFEVLSLTVSLISRLVFEYGYFCKRHNLLPATKTPFLIVYEEAHKYVPRSTSSRYNACRLSIERIAKEGRKYGVTLAIVSQRPSEISETIFAQCNNFVAMRLTNPDDQNYVRRLLPDTLGPLTASLPTLSQGEAVLIGDSVVMPSLVLLDTCDPEPSSSDIPYLQYWKAEWQGVPFAELSKQWSKIGGDDS